MRAAPGTTPDGAPAAVLTVRDSGVGIPLDVDSTVGEGTTSTVVLPAARIA